MKITFFFKIILALSLFITKTAYAIDPPVIKATGNQTYCSGTSLKIVETVSIISDPLKPNTDAIYIQISSGYVLGQDLLALANPLLHPTITTTWSSSEGKLTLFNPAGLPVAYSDFEAAIKDVTFTNSSVSPSGTRDFSINLGIGSANYLPSNGHFYEYVPSLGINWTKARDEAANKIYYGLKGYLATLTAADEAQLAGAQAPGTGWIGGSDAATEGTWKWVTGPEGLANGGTGIIFWIGKGNGTTTPPFSYANWNTFGNEPNDSNNNEDYAHITAPALLRPGTWNDLRETGDPIANFNYYPQGFIIEYGGMPGDPILKISASTTIAIPKITSTTPNSICGAGVVTLQSSATNGIVSWYTSNTGGTPIATGNLFTTPNLTITTPYYVDASNGSCATTPRTEITATIKTLPNLPQIAVSAASPVFYCLNSIAIPLAAIASANCNLNWYTLPTAGVASATSPTPNTTSAGSTTYYVSQTNTTNGCESPRVAIIVSVNPLPTAPLVNNISYCNDQTAVSLTASASANCTLNWYVTPTGGTPNATPLIPSTALVSSTKYYVSQTIIATGCEGPRAEIIVTVNPLPTAPVVTNSAYCHNEFAIPLTATASANCSLNWYTTITGGTSSATSPTPATASVGTIKYFVSQTFTATGCESPRSEIIVIISPLPVVNDVTITQCDSDLNADGKTLFNLTVNNNVISANYNNETFTYYTSLNGANNAVLANLISNYLAFENTTPTLMNVWSRITNKITGCYRVAKITLKVPATNINPNYKITFAPVCDDFLDINGNNTTNSNDRDGIATFDFSSTKAIILAQLPINQIYNITYYKNESDALAELNVITNISNYRNIGYPDSQDIWIRIDSNLDNACYGLGPYLTVNVSALPNIDLNLDGIDNKLVCSNLSTFFVTLDAGILDGSPTSNYNYIWTKNGIIVGTNSPTLDVNAVGDYTVEVINNSGCSRIRTITVIASNIATIVSIDVVDLTDVNTVTVKVTGSGDYLYSLDEPTGFWQDSNFFDNVPAGEHVVYVTDKNGCGQVYQEIAIVGVPKFFTPNGDSYNDVWEIKGISKYPQTNVQLFDRYGKYITTLNAINKSWNGIYNGSPLSADDYWYIINLGNGKPEIKGHFSLKR
jgi:gliding motility-associated-like protein